MACQCPNLLSCIGWFEWKLGLPTGEPWATTSLNPICFIKQVIPSQAGNYLYKSWCKQCRTVDKQFVCVWKVDQSQLWDNVSAQRHTFCTQLQLLGQCKHGLTGVQWPLSPLVSWFGWHALPYYNTCDSLPCIITGSLLANSCFIASQKQDKRMSWMMSLNSEIYSLLNNTKRVWTFLFFFPWVEFV